MDTVYSLLNEIPPVDPGGDLESVPLLQPGSLVLGSVRQLCQIRKIGAGGAVIHADIALEEGRRLELELDTGERLEGSIAWRRGSEVGLRFDDEIDVLPLLARNLASQPGERRRMPRIEVNCPGRVEVGDRLLLVMIRDIAQGGAKIDGPLDLRVGDRLVLIPEGLGRIEAEVRWVGPDTGGIAFSPELAWQEMMPWLRSLRNAGLCPTDRSGEGRELVPPDKPGAVTVQLNLAARVREGSRRWAIEVASLSQRSVQFECYAGLRLGTLLWVVLPGLEGWPARVVSIDRHLFTCEFTQPLHPAVIERIISESGRSTH